MPEPTQPLPGVLQQIQALPSSLRPLIICDVDEVILHMAAHLEDYLQENGLAFLREEYRLNGNIGRTKDQQPLPDPEVRKLLLRFFDDVSHRQDMVDEAAQVLDRLSVDWDVVLLTNLPGAHNKPVREKRLRELGIRFPVITNSGPKGGAVAALSAGRRSPIVFIDDSPVNHASVNASLPSAELIQFVASPRFAAMIEPEDHIGLFTSDWLETRTYIDAILGDG